MILWKRALLLGIASWAIPLAVSFSLFPLKGVNAGLFNKAINLVVILTCGLLLVRYFRDRPMNAREAVAVGSAWCAMNLVLDYPMFAYGPMQMNVSAYYSEIGLDYLAFPTFSLTAAMVAGRSSISAAH